MKKIALLLVLGLCTFALFAAGNQESSASATIMLAHDKKPWQESFLEMAALYNQETGSSVEIIGSPSTDIHQTGIRSGAVSSKAVELFTWWGGFRMEELVEAGALADISTIWDGYSSEYSDGLRDAFSFDGKTYGIPLNMNYWTIWYNKEVFETYDLDTPKTWVEFTELCDTLVDKGITPLGASVSGRWPAFIWFQELMIKSNPDAYEKLMLNQISYNDPAVEKAFDLWGDMIQKGYFNDPSLDWATEIPQRLASGDIAMYLMGNFITGSLKGVGMKPGEDLDTFILPSVSENVGNTVIVNIAPILLSAKADDLPSAKNFAKWWMSAQANEAWAEKRGFVPANQEADTDFLDAPMKNLLNEINSNDYRVLNRFWEATPVPVAEGAVDEFARFMLNPDEKNQVMENLVSIAEAYWNK